MNLKIRLSLMNFLEFATWGAYLTSMGRYLGNLGMGEHIGWFYSMQGIVSIFMPALMGIVADRWIPAQRLLGLCHLLAGGFMLATAFYGQSAAGAVDFATFFTLYALSVAFYMPTLALSNSVAYTALSSAGMDTIKDFPAIRVFGTIGFILTMWCVDLMGFQGNQNQFVTSAFVSFLLFAYTFSLPNCPTAPKAQTKTFVEAFGLRAFSLFKDKRMAIFFIFSMLLGVSLQITNSYANPFLFSFGAEEIYRTSFGVEHANILISLSQVSETVCILLIPFCMRRYGIKNVMLIAMFAWVLRFGLFGLGDPGFPGVLLLLTSMVVYGVAFDFFNVSGSLFVDKNTDASIRSSAQGLFMLMTNGIGATIGTLAAQAIVNHFTHAEQIATGTVTVGNWQACWFIFAAYALVVGVTFAIIFQPKKNV